MFSILFFVLSGFLIRAPIYFALRPTANARVSKLWSLHNPEPETQRPTKSDGRFSRTVVKMRVSAILANTVTHPRDRHGCSSATPSVGMHIETSGRRRGSPRPPWTRTPLPPGLGGVPNRPAHVVAHPGHAHDCRGGRPRIRLPSFVLGMPRKALVCKRGTNFVTCGAADCSGQCPASPDGLLPSRQRVNHDASLSDP